MEMKNGLIRSLRMSVTPTFSCPPAAVGVEELPHAARLSAAPPATIMARAARPRGLLSFANIRFLLTGLIR
jgi:hypothetical protein